MAKIINFRAQKGVPLARQRGLADALNMVFDILNGIEGDGSVSIQKVGRDWRIVCDASATGSGSSPTLTEITVVTDIQIDGQYLQIKTRTVKVSDPGTESDWTTIKTFPTFSD